MNAAQAQYEHDPDRGNNGIHGRLRVLVGALAVPAGPVDKSDGAVMCRICPRESKRGRWTLQSALGFSMGPW
ncbi:hypothetical protein GCM10022265_17220 [Marinobacter xestospongiae]